MNNLFISYDLNTPGQDYSRVIEAIKALGGWAKVQKSLWYVKTTLSASEALNRIRPTLDRNDSLIVVDATNKTATWHGLSDEVSDYIISSWIK
jgi:hypothetical protein